MKFRIGLKPIIISSMLVTSCITHAADSRAYLGGGLSKLELDGDSSVNISTTAGYNFKKWNFDSSRVQSLILGVEGQYSDSISGTDDISHYSVFVVARAYISDQWFFKIKQGITNFPDVKSTNTETENSHIGLGVGVGYQVNSGSIELEYVYPNKTLHASLFEIGRA